MTRRTITIYITQSALLSHENSLYQDKVVGVGEGRGGEHTRKSLFDIDHFPRTRLHKAASVLACILQSVARRHDSASFEIALVACDNLDRRRHADLYSSWGSGIIIIIIIIRIMGIVAELLQQPLRVLEALLGLDIDHVHEIVQRLQARLVGDVVHQQERVGFEIGRGPDAAVFLLAGCIGDGEEVVAAVDLASDRVGVLLSFVSRLNKAFFFSPGWRCTDGRIISI